MQTLTLIVPKPPRKCAINTNLNRGIKGMPTNRWCSKATIPVSRKQLHQRWLYLSHLLMVSCSGGCYVRVVAGTVQLVCQCSDRSGNCGRVQQGDRDVAWCDCGGEGGGECTDRWKQGDPAAAGDFVGQATSMLQHDLDRTQLMRCSCGGCAQNVCAGALDYVVRYRQQAQRGDHGGLLRTHLRG